MYYTCFYIYVKTTYKYLDLGEGIEHGEGDGGSEQEIRQGKGEYEDVSDYHYYQSRYPQEDTSSFDQSPLIASPSPSKSPFLLIF